MMSPNKISAAARTRMARIGEQYATAWCAVIEEHQTAGQQARPQDSVVRDQRDAGLDRGSVRLDADAFGQVRREGWP
jgi:hypothetical protein